MTLGEGTPISPASDSSLFSFWTFWGLLFFCPHLSLFLFCSSFEVDPQPLVMQKRMKNKLFSLVSKGNLVGETIVHGFLIKLPRSP